MSKVAKNPEKYVTTFPFASVKAASIHKFLKSILLVWHFGIRVSFALPLGRSCGIYILVGICGYPLLSVTASSTTLTWPTTASRFLRIRVHREEARKFPVSMEAMKPHWRFKNCQLQHNNIDTDVVDDRPPFPLLQKLTCISNNVGAQG